MIKGTMDDFVQTANEFLSGDELFYSDNSSNVRIDIKYLNKESESRRDISLGMVHVYVKNSNYSEKADNFLIKLRDKYGINGQIHEEFEKKVNF